MQIRRWHTLTLAEAIAESAAFSVAGGGDTLAAIEKFGIGDDVSYISTGGGAFLEFVEGKKLPAVAVLEERAAGNARLAITAAIPRSGDCQRDASAAGYSRT